MARVRPNLNLIRQAAAPAAAMLVIGYFAFSAVAGANGILSLGDYRRQLAAKQVELTRVQGHVAQLQHRVQLLDTRRGADPDYVDELVRARTGQMRDDEVVLPIR
ncbi:FtsB family cell division protein [Sphingomonas jatrophae]|uniref:Septum formation initiator n=1 Tax=Sphingomonas jatrophae TaxID=1166337 RepID=A0A1I6JK63_9SPHN|nr:septum formation initiator family protein [Sphingomonas jatrophae]SFR78980.1 Septum formation initiator [Sphingomonas jatrophae]